MSDTGKTNFSDCGQVQYIDGWTYGIDETGRTVCLGKEDDIKQILTTNKLTDDLVPLQRKILSQIIEYRQEEGFGDREVDMVNTGDDGTAGSKQEAISPSTPGKRIAQRASHQKHSRLLRR